MNLRLPRPFAAIFPVALVLIAVLTPHLGVLACGPDFEPDVFVRKTAPDNFAAFAKGQLGILQTGFDSNEFAVAFRYLNDGKLSNEEFLAYDHPFEVKNQTDAQFVATREAERATQSPDTWLNARADFPSVPTQPELALPKTQDGMVEFDPSYLNCPNAAFQTAALTLRKRVTAWGARSPWLLDWIHAQDTVFSNCAGPTSHSPDPAPADAPALLKADRAYQSAAAAFYAKHYEEAARQFAAISADKSSPWQPWGAYLAARATVRQAFAMGSKTDPYSAELATFDKPTMLRAQQMLETIAAQPTAPDRPTHRIIQDELNLVLIRTDPERRLTDLCTALAGPHPDPNFANDLADLNFALLKQIVPKNPPPLYAWIQAFRSTANPTPLALWQQNHALPWLVAALVQADPTDSSTPQLLAAAAAVPTSSPAYDTVFYHRVRLLIGHGQHDQARALLDQAIAPIKTPQDSHDNALLAERLAVARNYAEFLRYAPRIDLVFQTEGAFAIHEQCVNSPNQTDKNSICPDQKPHLQFDDDAVFVLNRQLPLTLFADAATSPSLPPNLREEVALAAWTRSIVLEDAPVAARLAPLLPKPLHQSATTGTGFPAVLAILRNPGLRPSVEPGVSRLATYQDLDVFRDNWWGDAADQDTNARLNPPPPLPLSRPDFLTSPERSAGTAQWTRLQQLPRAPVLLGRRVLDYAKTYPTDPEVPEALALTVRATHYGFGVYDQSQSKAENTAISKAAFTLLHTTYPKSPWTEKTRYYY